MFLTFARHHSQGDDDLTFDTPIQLTDVSNAIQVSHVPKSKKARNQLWTQDGFLRLLRTSPDLVDLFEEKLTLCANRAGRQGGHGLGGDSSVVNLRAGAAAKGKTGGGNKRR